jgi:plasmid maintenance system antidote protein VapI
MTVEGQEFAPRWASPPGETIQDVLEQRGLSQVAFAKAIGLPLPRLTGLLSGGEMISIDLARRIADSIGGSVEFWLARDGQYRDDLARVDADRWARSMPTAQMAAFGWIGSPVDWKERIASCLGFFDVSNVSEWRNTYGVILERAKFRVSDRGRLDVNATAAWLRKAEADATQLSCAPWDRQAFRELLPELRRLTRVGDPRRFVPSLVADCAAVGVAVVLLRAPSGCPASGVARYVQPARPHIALSARYLSDDHFWFSFFHEAAHLLLHDAHSVYVDDLDWHDTVTNVEEREADDLATSLLVPMHARELLQGRPTPTQIHKLARETGISSGVLVGQLQHAGAIGFDSVFNRLKRRYRWVGTSLEKA